MTVIKVQVHVPVDNITGMETSVQMSLSFTDQSLILIQSFIRPDNISEGSDSRQEERWKDIDIPVHVLVFVISSKRQI